MASIVSAKYANKILGVECLFWQTRLNERILLHVPSDIIISPVFNNVG